MVFIALDATITATTMTFHFSNSFFLYIFIKIGLDHRIFFWIFLMYSNIFKSNSHFRSLDLVRINFHFPWSFPFPRITILEAFENLLHSKSSHAFFASLHIKILQNLTLIAYQFLIVWSPQFSYPLSSFKRFILHY